MKIKRFLSCLLAALMLLGMLAAEGERGDRPHTHRFVDWYVESEATCTEPGMTRAHCSICGANASQAIPALGHDWGEWEDKGAYLERKCRRCGMTRQAPDTGSDPVLLLTGVDNGDGTVTLTLTNNGKKDLTDVALALEVRGEDGGAVEKRGPLPVEDGVLKAGASATRTEQLPVREEHLENGLHYTQYVKAVYTAFGTPASGGDRIASDPWATQQYPWAALPAAGKGPLLPVDLEIVKMGNSPATVPETFSFYGYVRNNGTDKVELTGVEYEVINGYYDETHITNRQFGNWAFSGGSSARYSADYEYPVSPDATRGYIDIHVKASARYAGEDEALKDSVYTVEADQRIYVQNKTLVYDDSGLKAIDQDPCLTLSAQCGDTVRYAGQDISVLLTAANESGEPLHWVTYYMQPYYEQDSVPDRTIAVSLDGFGGSASKIAHHTVRASETGKETISLSFTAYGYSVEKGKYVRSETVSVTIPVEPSGEEVPAPGEWAAVDLEIVKTGNSPATVPETFSFYGYVRNNGTDKVELTKVEYSVVNGYYGEDHITNRQFGNWAFSGGSGAQYSADYGYPVSPDATRGYIDIHVKAFARYAGENEALKDSVYTVEADQRIYVKKDSLPGWSKIDTFDEEPALTLAAECGEAIRYEGQEIAIRLTAKNEGASPVHWVMYSMEPMAGEDYSEDKTLAVSLDGKGGSVTRIVHHSVQSYELKQDTVTLSFKAYGWSAEKNAQVRSAAVSVAIPVKPAGENETEITLKDPKYTSAATYAGQTITVGITAENTGLTGLNGVSVSCSGAKGPLPEKSPGKKELAPGADDLYTFEYTVTEDDLALPSVKLTFGADAEDADSGTAVHASCDVSIPVSTGGTVPDTKSDPALETDGETEIALSNFKYGTPAVYPGQKIAVVIRVDNPRWNVLENVSVTCAQDASGASVPAESAGPDTLGVKGSAYCAFVYTVTPEDMAGTSIPFRFQASCTNSETGESASAEAYGSVPVAVSGTDDGGKAENEPSVLVDKTVTSHAKAKDERYEPFETIDYHIYIRNLLPYDVAGFTVYDKLLPGSGYLASTSAVASGASVGLNFSYQPDTEECGKGLLINQVFVHWTDPETGADLSAASNEVKVELYVPEPAEAAGGACCVRTLVSAEGGTLVWRTDACPAHAKLLGMGSGAEAEAAWLKAAGALYDGMLANADDAAAQAIRSERGAWFERHEALGRLLPLIAPDGETAQRTLTEDAMLRCTDLCCEAHTAPAPRADLVDPAAYAAGKYDSCTLDTEADGRGFTLTLGLCASHDGAGDLSALQKKAGDSVRVLQYALAGGDRFLVNSLRSAQADWFAARRALLGILYGADTADAILAADVRMCISQICAAAAPRP